MPVTPGFAYNEDDHFYYYYYYYYYEQFELLIIIIVNGLYVIVFRPQLAGAVAVEWRMNKFQVEQAGISREI